MDPFVLIIFGISGNLAQNKLLPALYDMINKGILTDQITILGSARKPIGEQEFKELIITSIKNNRTDTYDIDAAKRLTEITHYIQGDLTNADFYSRLKIKLDNMKKNNESCNNHMYYLATYPNLYSTIFKYLESSGLNKPDCGWVRLMIEKPLGSDLNSAKILNKTLSKFFKENQIFRLDHYLGKETLQNILAFRFGNELFDPLIRNKYIDHIQITSAETLGILDRGLYYDQFGALKDVGQNHLLQMLAFMTMDMPKNLSNLEVTKERLNVINQLTINPNNLILGQYDGYQNELNVKQGSDTNTFFALKTTLNHPRLKGVPVYFRAGKKLAQAATEISVVFKPGKHPLFDQRTNNNGQNVLIFRIQPNEAIVIKMLIKKPGKSMQLKPVFMQFCYRNLPDTLPDPYENLLLDALEGDQVFFNNAAEVEAQWKFIGKFSKQKHPVEPYSPGSWGPESAVNLIRSDNREWLEPSMEFCQT